MDPLLNNNNKSPQKMCFSKFFGTIFDPENVGRRFKIFSSFQKLTLTIYKLIYFQIVKSTVDTTHRKARLCESVKPLALEPDASLYWKNVPVATKRAVNANLRNQITLKNALPRLAQTLIVVWMSMVR